MVCLLALVYLGKKGEPTAMLKRLHFTFCIFVVYSSYDDVKKFFVYISLLQDENTHFPIFYIKVMLFFSESLVIYVWGHL